MKTDKKIISYTALTKLREQTKKENRSIVLTTGCYDILHLGHVIHFNYCKSNADILVVSVGNNETTRHLKGENRPINDEKFRARMIAALECVDYVVRFDEEKPLNLIKTIRPDVLVKGGDYSREQVVGHEIVESYGGTVSLIPVINNASTTTIIKRIKETS